MSLTDVNSKAVSLCIQYIRSNSYDVDLRI